MLPFLLLLMPSTFSGYHWPFLASLGSLQTSKPGLGHLSVKLSLLYRNELYVLMDLNLFLLWAGSRALAVSGLLVPRAAFFGLFSPPSALSWLLSAVPLSSHHKPAVPASSLKQVQRSSNSQLWYNSYGCSLLYTPDSENTSQSY